MTNHIPPTSYHLPAVDDLGIALSIIEVCLSSHAEAFRSPARDARSPHPEDALARAAARLGDRQTHPTALRRRAVRAAGLALSGTPSPRESGMDHRRVEEQRARARCQGV